MPARGLPRTCPTCGRVLDERPWQVCPRCREPIPGDGEQLPPAGMLTNFGLGMCGLVAGGMIACSLAVNIDSPWPLASRMVLWPLGLGTFAAASSAWIGPRLLRPARRSFERLMIALMIAACIASPFTIAAWRNVYAMAGLVVGGTLGIYAYLRGLPPDWGLEPPDGKRGREPGESE